jgi:hypothetical protein
MRARIALSSIAALAVGATITVIACQEPTEIVVKVRTSFDCAALAGNKVSIRVGTDVSTGPVQSTSTACKGRSAGSLVLTPSGAGDRVTIDVMAALSPASLDGDGRCVEGTAGCIHARRSLVYLKRTIEVPIELDDACAGKQCDPTFTCFRGGCVPADCAVSGSQCTVGDSDAGATDAGASPLAPLCGAMSDLQAGAPYPMSLGCGGGSAVSAEKGPASAPTRETPITVSGDTNDIVIDKNNVAYLSTLAGYVDAIDLNAEPPKKLWTAQFSPQTASLVSAIVGADGTIYVGSLSSVVAVFPDAGVGKAAPTSSNIRSDLGLSPGLLAFMNASSEVETLRLDAGLAPGPKYALGAGGDYFHPVGYQGSLWVGASDGTLRQIAPSTMTETGRVPLTDAGTQWVSTMGGPDGRLRVLWYTLPQGPLNVASIDAATRQIVWTRTLPTAPFAEAELLGVTLDGTLWVRSGAASATTYAADGTLLATFPAGSVYSTFDVDGYFYSEDATMNALAAWDAKGKRRWVSSFTGRNLRIAVVGKNGAIVAASYNSAAYVYRP